MDGILDPQTIEIICQAALEPKLWPNALASVLPRFHSKHISFFTIRHDSSEEPFLAHSGFSDAELQVHFSPEAMQCWESWRPRLPLGKAFTNRHIMSDREWSRSETYNEYVRHSGVYQGALFNTISPDMSFHFAICRPGVSNPYTDAELTRLQLLMPHIALSLRLRRRLRTMEQRAGALSAVLDRLNEGVIVVSAKGVPLLANARAQALLDRGDVLSDGPTGLRARRSSLTQNLLDAVRAVSDPRWTGDLYVSLPRKKPMLPILLEIVSLAQCGTEVHGVGQAAALIFIKEPDAPRTINRQALADTLLLSRREMDVATLLAQGFGTEKIAEETGIAVGTVRFHIKRMFQKTGVRNQAALVSLLHGFASR